MSDEPDALDVLLAGVDHLDERAAEQSDVIKDAFIAVGDQFRDAIYEAEQGNLDEDSVSDDIDNTSRDGAADNKVSTSPSGTGAKPETSSANAS